MSKIFSKIKYKNDHPIICIYLISSKVYMYERYIKNSSFFISMINFPVLLVNCKLAWIIG